MPDEKKVEGKTKHREWQSARRRGRKIKGGEGDFFWRQDIAVHGPGKIASVSSDLLDRVSSLLYGNQPQVTSRLNLEAVSLILIDNLLYNNPLPALLLHGVTGFNCAVCLSSAIAGLPLCRSEDLLPPPTFESGQNRLTSSMCRKLFSPPTPANLISEVLYPCLASSSQPVERTNPGYNISMRSHNSPSLNG